MRRLMSSNHIWITGSIVNNNKYCRTTVPKALRHKSILIKREYYYPLNPLPLPILEELYTAYLYEVQVLIEHYQTLITGCNIQNIQSSLYSLIERIFLLNPNIDIGKIFSLILSSYISLNVYSTTTTLVGQMLRKNWEAIEY